MSKMSQMRYCGWMVVVALIVLSGTSALKAAEPLTSSVWRVKGAHATVYLCGSVHLLSKSDFPYPPQFDEAYRDASQVYFEVLLENMMNPQVLSRLQKYMTPQKTLKREVTPKTYGILQNYLKKNGISSTAMDNMPVWMVVQRISQMEIQKVGASAAWGVDIYYTNLAKKDGKKRGGLESVERQMEVLSGLSEGLTDTLLLQTLEEVRDVRKEFKEIVKGWREGDEKKVDEVMLRSLKEHPGLREAVLTSRNREWIPKIEGMLEGDENVMVVVGVGHLVGTDSVVELLRKKGYQVERL